MRYLYLLLLVVAIIVVAFWADSSRPGQPVNGSLPSSYVEFTNLPRTYCPTQATVVNTSRLNRPQQVSVINCSVVSLSGLDLTPVEQIFIKLPNALGISINYREETDRYRIALKVGDVNGDNVIDDEDIEIITEQIFSSQTSADVDMSGIVDSDDLALARINSGVGEYPPGYRSSW